MSTIASPRTSLSLSSRRTSLSNEAATLRSPASSRAPAAASSSGGSSTRRNRAALRDYYKLSAESDDRLSSTASINPGLGIDSRHDTRHADGDKNDESDGQEHDFHAVSHSEIDEPGFNVETYIDGLLSEKDIEGVLKAATRNAREIRILEGEKKALVYNNYAKLITATDTIRQMREKMDPMMPTTESLKGDFGKIADLMDDIQKKFANLTADLDTVTNGKA